VLLAIGASSLLSGASSPLVVTHAALWTERETRSDYEIVIRDGRIAAVGRSGTLDRPTGARVIDADGDTLLPGLIDAHVHLVSGVRLPPEFRADARARVAAKQLLRSGVTSGRIHLWDLPTAISFKREAAKDDFPGPRLQIGGPALFGGHPDWDAANGNVWGVMNVDDAIVKVRRLHDAGVEWLALHELRRFQPGELDAIVSEARRLGLRLIAGGDRPAEVERAIEVGVDSIEYLDRTDAPLYPDTLVARMRECGASLFLVPAIGFPHRFAAYRSGAMPLEDPRYTEFMPAEIAAFAGDALREDRVKDIPHAPNNGTVPPALDGKFRQLRAAGLQLVVGTDCGSPMHIHADAIWWELETWRLLGVAVDEIVRAATTLPAGLLQDPDIGHLGIGARGDFILYRGRLDDGPLTVERIRTVVKAGVLFVNDGAWIGSSDQMGSRGHDVWPAPIRRMTGRLSVVVR
jgi:imidazolonepropionase-like amidohydrolase